MMNVVIKKCCQKIVGNTHRMQVTIEVQIDVLHRMTCA